MKTFIALLLGLLIGAGVVYYYRSQRANVAVREAGQQGQARSSGDVFQEKLESLNLRTGDIKEELERTGRVIRQKAEKAGETITDATADARVTAEIKAKLLRDSELSGWSISVNTTGGVVTLSGSVASPELIAKAIALALEVEGARQVISTLQVKA